MKPFELLSFRNPQALAQTAAVAWLEEVAKSTRAGKPYSVALSGGRIALDYFSAVVEASAHRRASFCNVHFFWADERCVPPSDPESNYRLARERLLDPLNIPEGQIHRVLGEASPEVAADSAAKELCSLALRDHNSLPVLDMVFLGLGEDGHVASLFPTEHANLPPKQCIYRAVTNSPKPPPERVTLDYPTITAARKVWMLASGTGKESALRASLSPSGTTPFAHVLHCRSDTRIFSDISTS